jgi:putative mycofactocin binding protein MftB
VTFDGTRPWTLHPQVSLRPESFGALAYHFGTRRLSFLKSRDPVAVVESLADQPTGHDACRAAGVTDGSSARYERALATSGRVRDDLRAGDVMTLVDERPPGRAGPGGLVDQFERGLDAPICLTWELTYACNLACVHCLSSSGRRDPRTS